MNTISAPKAPLAFSQKRIIAFFPNLRQPLFFSLFFLSLSNPFEQITPFHTLAALGESSFVNFLELREKEKIGSRMHVCTVLTLSVRLKKACLLNALASKLFPRIQIISALTPVECEALVPGLVVVVLLHDAVAGTHVLGELARVLARTARGLAGLNFINYFRNKH